MQNKWFGQLIKAAGDRALVLRVTECLRLRARLEHTEA